MIGVSGVKQKSYFNTYLESVYLNQLNFEKSRTDDQIDRNRKSVKL